MKNQENSLHEESKWKSARGQVALTVPGGERMTCACVHSCVCCKNTESYLATCKGNMGKVARTEWSRSSSEI